MNQLDFIIRLIADLTGGKLTEDQIAKIKDRYNEMGQESAKAGNLGADAIKSIVAQFAPFVTIAGAAVATWESLNHAIDAFAAHQDQIIGLDAALANHGNLTDSVRAKYHALAAEQEADTKIIADRWLEVIARLTRFGAKPEEMEQYVDAVKNLAGLMGTDIESAGHVFTRVMEGQFTFLKRYGIVVEETGDKHRDLNRVMEQLAAGGAGVLDAKAKALSGTFADVKNNATHFFETLGEGIAKTGILQSLLGGATNVIKDMTGSLRDGAEPASILINKMTVFSKASATAGESAKKAAEETTKALKDELDALDALQARQDALTDAMMAGELATAKLNAEKKKFGLSPDDKEGRKQIDLDLEAHEAGIREKYTTKKLADEKEILSIKQQALQQEDEAAKQDYLSKNAAAGAARLTRGQAGADLTGALRVIDEDPEQMKNLPALFASLQKAQKDYLPGSAGAAANPGYAAGLADAIKRVEALNAANAAVANAESAQAAADIERGNVGERVGGPLADVNAKLRVNQIEAGTARATAAGTRAKAADESQVAEDAKATRDATTATRDAAKESREAQREYHHENIQLHRDNAEELKRQKQELEQQRRLLASTRNR